MENIDQLQWQQHFDTFAALNLNQLRESLFVIRGYAQVIMREINKVEKEGGKASLDLPRIKEYLEIIEKHTNQENDKLTEVFTNLRSTVRDMPKD